MIVRLTTILATMIFAGGVGAAELLSLKGGTPLTVALEHLRVHGLRVVYSSELVPRTLLVDQSVSGSDPAGLARAVLKPHGLGLRPLGSGVLGIVQTRSGPRWVLTGRVFSAQGDEP